MSWLLDFAGKELTREIEFIVCNEFVKIELK